MLTHLRHPRGRRGPLGWSNEEIIMRVRVKILWYRSREKTQLRRHLCSRTLQLDMTQTDLRWSIRDALNPIENSGKGNWFDKEYIVMDKVHFFIIIVIFIIILKY